MDNWTYGMSDQSLDRKTVLTVDRKEAREKKSLVYPPR